LALASEAGTTTKATLAFSRALAGNPSYAKEVAADFEKRITTEYISPVDMVLLYIGIGDKDTALDWVERAIEERRGWAAYLRVHPIVDSLRAEPRFAELVKKMGFDAPAAPPVVVPPAISGDAITPAA